VDDHGQSKNKILPWGEAEPVGFAGPAMIRIAMETAKPPLLLSCPDCDALFSAPVVRENERVICPQCQANLFSRRPNFVHRAAALVFAAALFFILANAFPFLTLQANYRQSSMHLVGCVSGLDAQGFHLLAAMVGVFTLAAPTLLIAGLLYILVPLLRGRRLPWALPFCRAIREARSWSMVEVFLLGVVVSLLKLGTVATLTLGTSFWAFVGLMVCLIAALTLIDYAELWEQLEVAQE
jgi:paraquat-inducible protein A